MRRIALSLLVAVTGCNWVFGLKHTQPADAAPDTPDGPPDAPFLKMIFERQVGTTDVNGMPVAGMSAAISPAPAIQLGPLDGPLSPSAYDAGSHSFIVPFELPGNPWRLVYTTDADPVPTEFQWTANAAHLTLPSLARPGDASPPAGSGWDFRPTPTPTILAPRVMTSGAFTSTVVPSADLIGGGKEVGYEYAKYARGLFGPVGTPTVAQGDWALLYDYRFISGGVGMPQIYGSVGYAWVQADLAAGAQTVVTPPWVATTSVVNGINWADTINGPRLNTVSSLGGACCSHHLEYGIVPSPYIAPFQPSATGVDAPSMVDLLVDDDATGEPLAININAPSTTQVKLPRMLLAAYVAPRVAFGVTLTNTIQTLGTPSTLEFAAPLATKVQLGTVGLMTGSADNQVVPASASSITLQWTPESISSGTVTIAADDYVVTLYEIAANTLSPIRRYQVLAPRVEVDGTLLQQGHRYVFGITSRNGYPNAVDGDYSTIRLPFSEATVFPLAFVIQ
jgi:hypothetical protein